MKNNALNKISQNLEHSNNSSHLNIPQQKSSKDLNTMHSTNGSIVLKAPDKNRYDYYC